MRKRYYVQKCWGEVDGVLCNSYDVVRRTEDGQGRPVEHCIRTREKARAKARTWNEEDDADAATAQ